MYKFFNHGVKCDSDDDTSSFGYCLALKMNKKEVWRINKNDMTQVNGLILSSLNEDAMRPANF
jgi:hypothetical protein